MNRQVFPFLALGIGLTIAAILLLGGAISGQLLLPLLAALLMAEFGFIINLAGLYFGYMAITQDKSGMPVILATVGCALIAIFLAWVGFTLWPDTTAM